MKKLYVKSEDILKQLNGIQLRPRDVVNIIGMSSRNASNFLKGKTNYIGLDYADKLCGELGLELPDDWYSQREVQYEDVTQRCKACDVTWDVINLECETCLSRQLRRLVRKRKDEDAKRIKRAQFNNAKPLSAQG